MKTTPRLRALLFALATAALVTPLSAIKIVVPEQYQDQIESIKEAERAQREAELTGDVASGDAGALFIDTVEEEPTEAAVVDADAFLLESVAEATGTASAFEGNLAANEGLISGQIVDKDTGEPLAGVAILIEGTQIATVTDSGGRYSLGPAPAGIYTLSFIKTGYIEANVTEYTVAGGEVSVFPFALPPRPAEMSDEVYELQDFTVTAQEANELMANIELRLDSDSLLNVMSSEDFSRFAASDAAEALIRVPGVSIQNGKYAVIRGLAERYASAELNGLPLISPDPDRLAVQLDIFPSSLLDTIIVQKTFTPDMPGEATGGAVNVVTKSMPDERIANFSFKLGGNSNVASAGKFPLDYEGRNDWLANGFGDRDFPPDASEQGFRVENADPQINLGPFTDVGFSFNYGDTYTFDNGQEFGFVFGGYYDFGYSYIEEDNERWEDDGSGEFDPLLNKQFTVLEGSQESTFAFLLGFGYKPSENHKLSGDVFFIRTGESSASFTETSEFIAESIEYTQREMTSFQLFGEHTFDLGGSLFPEVQIDWGGSISNNLQQETRRGYNAGINSTVGGVEYQIGQNHDTPPSVVTRTTDQDNEALSLDITLPTETEWKFELKGGLAYENADRVAEQTDLKYIFVDLDDATLQFLEENPEFKPFFYNESFETEAIDDLSQLSETVPLFGEGQTDAVGKREIKSYYLMATVEPTDWLEIVGGARVEDTFISYTGEGNTLQVNFDVDFLNEPIDQEDVLPSLTAKVKVSDEFTVRLAASQTVSRPSFRELSPFVSLNFTDTEVEVGNSPISWVPSGSLGPPPPPLEMGEIDNYDIRFEYVAENADMAAVSFFYKEVTNAIERTVIRDLKPDGFGASSLPVFSWVNNDNDAEVMGVEVEFRKNLGFFHESFSDFSLGGNVTYIESEVERSSFELDQRIDKNASIEDELTKSRSLQGQPDLLANLDISYSNDEIGTDITLALNYQGEQLESIGSFKEADRYIQPYIRVDATWKQRINDYWTVKLSVENITDSKREVHYDEDQTQGTERLVKSYRKGIDFSISATCKF